MRPAVSGLGAGKVGVGELIRFLEMRMTIPGRFLIRNASAFRTIRPRARAFMRITR